MNVQAEGTSRSWTGRRLGAYWLESAFGSGPLGHVYRARGPHPGRLHAVKVVEGPLASDPAFQERFLWRARTAASLAHPGIVTVEDFGIEDGVPYVVTAYVESITLADLLDLLPARQRSSDPSIRTCVPDIAAALDHAHTFGVVHGDLKQANVLIRASDGRALLTDFGMALDREPTTTDDMRSFAALLQEIAGDAAAVPAPGARSATDLAAACLAALDRATPEQGPGQVEATPNRWRLPAGLARTRARIAAAMLAAVVVVGGGAALATRSRATSPPVPASALHKRVPAPVSGSIGGTANLTGVLVSVSSETPNAHPPPGLGVPPGTRLVVLEVTCTNIGGRQAVVSPYDWVVTDAAGSRYDTIDLPLPDELSEQSLPRDSQVRGEIGFLVPTDAKDLAVVYDDEFTDDQLIVPLG